MKINPLCVKTYRTQHVDQGQTAFQEWHQHQWITQKSWLEERKSC